jgi:hypothetical protein
MMLCGGREKHAKEGLEKADHLPKHDPEGDLKPREEAGERGIRRLPGRPGGEFAKRFAGGQRHACVRVRGSRGSLPTFPEPCLCGGTPPEPAQAARTLRSLKATP